MVQMLIRKGKILLNGKHPKSDTRLEEGDTIETRFDEWHDTDYNPENAGESDAASKRDNPAIAAWGTIGDDVPILFEDESVLVLNKPPGIVVQPGNRKEKGSMLDLLEEYRTRTAPPQGAGPIFPYTPVHRLDRETSGALVVAKTRPAARALSKCWAGGTVEKTYLAVVQGTPSPERGTVSKSLSLAKGKRSRAAEAPDGKTAFTRYALKRRLTGGTSLLEVIIETGRTHQIRIHLASIGHPVVGDRAYGHGGPGERLLLHAWKIRFPHPETAEPIEVTAPSDIIV
jgi:RluA family pseudouridine synthase